MRSSKCPGKSGADRATGRRFGRNPISGILCVPSTIPSMPEPTYTDNMSMTPSSVRRPQERRRYMPSRLSNGACAFKESIQPTLSGKSSWKTSVCSAQTGIAMIAAEHRAKGPLFCRGSSSVGAAAQRCAFTITRQKSVASQGTPVSMSTFVMAKSHANR